jgi:hypothetical protein
MRGIILGIRMSICGRGRRPTYRTQIVVILSEETDSLRESVSEVEGSLTLGRGHRVCQGILTVHSNHAEFAERTP